MRVCPSPTTSSSTRCAATSRDVASRRTARAIPLAELERPWSREGVPVREGTLWRLLYETAGRAGEILALEVGISS
jgi:hypothetical protein